MDICMMVYWGKVHDDMFETCINTFRKYSNALLQVYSDEDDIPIVADMVTRDVVKDKVKGRRALCKIECLQELISQLNDGDRLLVSDIDVYFLGDPFTAFDKFKFDVGITTRSHRHIYPVNGGIFYIYINKQTRDWIKFHLEQVIEPTWETLVAFRTKYKRIYTPDWTVGQDFLNACYLDPEYIKEKTGVIVKDVGCYYNYCPCSFSCGYLKAAELIKSAYEKKDVCVLHLKSSLKMCIYENWMDAVRKKPCGTYNWEDYNE